MSMVKQIDNAELERMRQSGAVVLLDVRTDPEVARGIIAGARHIPLHLVPARYTELAPHVATVIYASRVGARHRRAWLLDKGFAQVSTSGRDHRLAARAGRSRLGMNGKHGDCRRYGL
jgi:rhodanese-related sulfurtransferase